MLAQANSGQGGLAWLMFALMTVASWGVYGVLLHSGQMAMGDPANGRYKAFLFVGIAYFLTAVLAPLVVLLINKATWSMPIKGMSLSLFAGIVGAIGAFCVLLAFGAAPQPKARYVPVVMSIIFAGAPIVNAIVALLMHPPEGGFAAMRPQFYLGIILAAVGGCMVALYKDPATPQSSSHKSKPANVQPASPAAATQTDKPA